MKKYEKVYDGEGEKSLGSIASTFVAVCVVINNERTHLQTFSTFSTTSGGLLFLNIKK